MFPLPFFDDIDQLRHRNFAGLLVATGLDERLNKFFLGTVRTTFPGWHRLPLSLFGKRATWHNMPSRIDRLKSNLAARTEVDRGLINETVRRTINRPAWLRRLAQMIATIHLTIS